MTIRVTHGILGLAEPGARMHTTAPNTVTNTSRSWHFAKTLLEGKLSTKSIFKWLWTMIQTSADCILWPKIRNNITKNQLSLLVSTRIFSIFRPKKWIGPYLMQQPVMKYGTNDLGMYHFGILSRLLNIQLVWKDLSGRGIRKIINVRLAWSGRAL